MKIPETSANVGAYYGNEENGQWQPNGVIIDSGVAGGVVGSGDGLHPAPVYPVHIPREHIPGYVMAGAYYAGAGYPAPADDFADYMWMENEEEFDKQVMQQLEEEALMEQCIEAMLEDEQRELERNNTHNTQHYPTTSNGNPSLSLEETVSRSKLNPLAAEFVPTWGPRTEEKRVPEVKSTEETQKEPSETEEAPQVTEEVKTEEPLPPVEPPEVSAAHVPPIDSRRDSKKDARPKAEPKKTAKVEPKKAKPAVVKSETKVQPKKKEVKAVKSEPRLEEREKEDAPVVVAELPKVSLEVQPPLPSSPAGPKPINYAAAARANKPKPAAPAPAPAPAHTAAPADKLKDKKPVQRKNSAK